MKAFSSKTGRQDGVVRTLLALLTLFLVVLSGRADTLLVCTNATTGDFYYRGFYVPSYPGNSLTSARLVFTSPTAGDYTVRLTARSNTYDGLVLGSSATTFNLAVSTDRAVTFNFPSVRIRENSRVCFIMTITSGPSTALYYSVGPSSGGCPTIVETEGTTPPLDTFRRNGVELTLTGEDTLIVAPGETIQAAIDAADIGDTVRVDPGTYTENLRLRSGVNVVGSGFATTILRGLGNSNVVTAINTTNSRFEGFKITRSGTNTSHAGVNISGGNLLLNNNWIIGNLNGVRLTTGSSSIIRNNIIEKNGTTNPSQTGYGILCASSTPLIANNLVVSNSGLGISIQFGASSGAQVINNTVAENTESGIWCYSLAHAVLKNNIVTRNRVGIYASVGAVPLISFNDVFGNTVRNYDAQTAGVASPGPGDISVNPLFELASSPPFRLSIASPCINAGDSNPIFNDLDGSRNDMGCFGGPGGIFGGVGPSVTSGFLFTSIGKIPTSEITQSGASAGLANVSPAVSGALSIHPHKDAPFGGNLWLNGLFGSSDTSIRYYRLYAAPWVGNSAPAPAAFQPITDPLSKIKYTVNPGGTVTASLEPIGPNADGLYLRTDSGYWAHPDLMAIWNTRALPNGRYDILCRGYYQFFGFWLEATLPENELTRITVWVNNDPVTATINQVRDAVGTPIPECGHIPLANGTQNLQFDITASHPGGFLMNYSLDVLYGRNQGAGYIVRDQYTGSNDSNRPVWSGITNIVSSAPAQAADTLQDWTSCAYQFRLSAWARTTDGFGHLYHASFSDHYSLNVLNAAGGLCVADLDHDGDVDGVDLAIFAAQYGRTNCVALPTP
jgi:parallel beta-helix repeat protein